VVGGVLSLACLLAACGGSVVEAGASAPGGGASCAGDAGCDPFDDLSSPLGPACTTDPLPRGTGGTIADGTYLLASQTYYGVAGSCPSDIVSETMLVAGGCMQIAGKAQRTLYDSPSATLRASASFVVHGATISITPACIAVTGTAGDGPSEATFTSDGTTLTIFFHTPTAAAGYTDHAEVLRRQ
jgi:hypothetical protein